MKNEEWREIPGFPHYQASNLGRVKSIKAGKGSRASVNGGILKCHAQECAGDYQRMITVLRRGGRNYRKFVHHLILETFIGERPDGAVALHKNGNPIDNRSENLRWGTMSENTKDSIRHGTKTNPPVHSGESHHLAKISDKAVLKIRAHNFIRGDQARFAREYGVSETTISRIRKGISRAPL